MNYKTGTELDEMANEICQYVTIRQYEEGTSVDTKRKAHKKEREILFNIVRSALGILNYTEQNHENNGIIDGILLTAEITADRFIPNLNGYITVNIPLRNAVNDWNDW